MSSPSSQGSSSASSSQSSSSSQTQSDSGNQSPSADGSTDIDQGNNTGANASTQGSMNQSSSSGASSEMGSDQSASSIFDESLGDFDSEMAGERVIIAAANQSLGGMTAQENADAATVQQGGLDGPLDMESGQSPEANSSETVGQNKDEDSSENQMDQSTDSTSSDQEKIKERIPDDIPMDGTGEDVIARQIREAAVQEEDPIIREALWDEYRKHMGIKK